MARRRVISEDEAALWQAIAKTAKPLKRRRKPEAKPTASPPPSAAPKTPPKQAKPRPIAVARPTSSPVPTKPTPTELAHGHATGIDKRQAERFSRGKTRIEGRIDLHGHTQAQAHGELQDFILRAHAGGKRCLLVITGKGMTGSKPGILRTNVPRWLNEPGLRSHVLAFDYAEPQHGGEGALYVLLKRQKDGGR